ncbi:hypothetical protein Pcinc_003166 [Petrolisthes cinctipes]|uniref:Uncharacterized protein n=1 Tax=Petrolisthes cinctipes TaxID=88211 RepID=A0AAE1L2R0_PETCI|nr:hypothetical protein Pcinc_003166 [Petrolisthes cinctipes]
MVKNTDVLVRWDQDNTENVVPLRDLKLPAGKKLRNDMKVKMWWQPSCKWWSGIVIQFSEQKTSYEGREDSDDDIPLTEFLKRIGSSSTNTKCDESEKDARREDRSSDHSYLNTSSDSTMSECDSVKDPLYVPEDDVNIDDELVAATVCGHKGCLSEIFAACTKLECQRLFCKNHCMTYETENYTTVDVYEKKQHDSYAKNVAQPEHFTVDVMHKLSPVKRRKVSKKEEIRQLCKKNRNSGEVYISIQSGKEMPARRMLQNRCPAKTCGNRGLLCDQETEEQRKILMHSFYDLGNVESQRQWISRNIEVKDPNFLKCSVSIQRITLSFYKTNLGQSEGDSMHSTIERAVRRAGEAIVPAQLTMIIRLATKVPYKLIEVKPPMIKDWKQYSQELRILRIRV